MPEPTNTEPLISLTPKAESLILRFEVGGGQSYYEKFLARPTWPGDESGVTIGIGYDLDYEVAGLAPFGAVLPAETVARLNAARGLKGSRAQAFCHANHDIEVPWAAALQVFNEYTVPREIARTKHTFPGSENLPPDAFGALVSLVFNRGTDLEGPRRQEMAAIAKTLQTQDPRDPATIRRVAGLVLLMRRLWSNNVRSDGDLYDRRTEEAALILSTAPAASK